MFKTLLLTLLFFTSCLRASESEAASLSSHKEPFQEFVHTVSQEVVSVSASTLFTSASYCAKLGWGLTSLSGTTSPLGHDCLLFSDLCKDMAKCFDTPILNSVDPYTSWNLNQMQLSQIPAFLEEDQELLLFLKNRFLAKSTGFFPELVQWVYPHFGIHVQTHPETTGSYARSPLIKLSKAYQKRVANWKQTLSHPESYPLILTRPSDLHSYLPSYVKVEENEPLDITVKKLKEVLQKPLARSTLDCTSIPLEKWASYQSSFLEVCKKQQLDPLRILCVQRVEQKALGGLRLLPFSHFSKEDIAEQHQFLIEWISTFGLSANRIELDRSPLSASAPLKLSAPSQIPLLSKKEFCSYLDRYDFIQSCAHPQKNFMMQGALSSLKGLFEVMSEDQWKKISKSPTRVSIAELSFYRIKEELDLIKQSRHQSSFFDTASHMEQIYAHLSSLLEISSPFAFEEFSPIYQALLTSIPKGLKSLTSCSLHSSGMTSLAGIFQATHKTLGREPRVLYGENTYYECINAARLASNASPASTASEKDFKEVDLLLVQFNPVWKGTDLQKTTYTVENVRDTLHRSLKGREGKSLTVALDCTFDFIDSPRAGELLVEFEKEIQEGILNIVCYRSGLKFDLFGMDNYCGAPFYMIHSKDSQWSFFDALLADPVLKTDRLSLNWFCLAFQNAAPQLEMYRKQIFENTRDLLDKIPKRLFARQDLRYQVIPFQSEADPAFIDITIKGPFHKIRAEALISGYLTVRSMEQGFPLFYRISIGLYHANLTELSDAESSSIRLTLGLDPAQVDLFVKCFEKIDTLND